MLTRIRSFTARPPVGAWTLALAGLVSLAVAMGIGRFAFTPILPMMLSDGVVSLPQASWLASSNYLGYMLGAVLCTLQPWIWARWQSAPQLAYSSIVRGGLLATAALTLAMAAHWPAAWPALRFAAGVTSAVVFVYTSGWCLARLAALGVPSMGGLIYVGPGAGIVVSGLMASGLVAWGWPAYAAWLVFGVLALLLAASVWRTLRGTQDRLAPRAAPAAQAGGGATAPHGRTELGLLLLAYGLAGFGYIITATFLPVIARASLPESVWLDLFWPIFGVGVMLGAVLATRVPAGRDLRGWLAACYGIQAVGVGASLLSPSVAGFALGSGLLGLPFTAITFFAMQEARRVQPLSAASFMGLLTATYGVGQIAGPPLAAWLLSRMGSAQAGFTLSLQAAGAALVGGMCIYAWMMRRYPVKRITAD